MLHQNNENDDLDDWEREDEEKFDETITFPVKKQSIEEKAFKEEIERTNQQTVNDLFKVNNTGNATSTRMDVNNGTNGLRIIPGATTTLEFY